MKLYSALLCGLLLLAGCGKADQAAAPAEKQVATPTAPEVPVMGREVRIVALGDSLFAGYGVKPGESYPAKLERALRARGINARIANAGVSGDTSLAGLERLSFTLNSQQQAPELALISLGGNDMLRGLPPEQTRQNLDAILTELGKRRIKSVLMGMLSPPNMGADYRRKFDAIYPALAKKHDAALVPFFLSAVIDKPDLIQADRVHPTARGIEEMIAATVGEVTKAMP
jgi:acyl-CoA thioesterase I